MKNVNTYTVATMAAVTGFSTVKVSKVLGTLGVSLEKMEGGKKGVTNLRKCARLCRDINPEEITVRYAAQELRAQA